MIDVFDLAKKVLYIFRTHDIRGIKSAVDNLVGRTDVLGFYGWIAERSIIPLDEHQKEKQGSDIVVNWIIPDIGVGSGGHMNIFRFISMIEDMGMHNRIYLYASTRFENNDSFRDFLKKHYSATLANPGIEKYYSVDEMRYAQATIATGWQTAYFVRRFNNTDHKFYFVQDFEPCFFAMGSEYIFAENTYKFGFKGITAGDWLKEKLHDEYGMETESFGFSYDREIYKPVERTDFKQRIFFYARPATPWRACELGLLALNEVYKRKPDIEVWFAGGDISNFDIPFEHKNMGSVRVEELSEIYAQCDICLVLSTSNLSLLPLEIMASNGVVATSYGANNEWLLNEDNAVLFENDPVIIADKLIYCLDHPQMLEEKRKKGLEFVKNTSWEAEGTKVYEILLNDITSGR